MEVKFDTSLPIAMASDHAGYDYKNAIKKQLLADGKTVEDFGTHSVESTDYPDYAHPAAQMVAEGKAGVGILICGSGNGVCMTANKHPEIRAALCWEKELAALGRQHNNANVLCLPARFISLENALDMVETFLNTEFEGGRHERRTKKI